MDKPVVFNYKKAMDRIADLEAENIQLHLELQHLRDRTEPKDAIAEKLITKVSKTCPTCGSLIMSEPSWCQFCGQRLKYDSAKALE